MNGGKNINTIMNDNKCCESKNKSATKKKRRSHRKKKSLSNAPDCASEPKRKIPTMVNKAIQIDMDYEPGEDPKKNMKYWQDLAGLRGARQQYLELDIRDLGAERLRQSEYIKYLKSKLEMANKQIAMLEKKQCRCNEEKWETAVITNKSFSSMGL